MSKTLIETIPHTGTRFISKLFYRLGLVETSLDDLQSPTTNNAYAIKHFPPTYWDDSIYFQRVTTLRDPCLVAISNIRGHLFQESFGVDVETLNRQYDVFVKRATRRKYVYVDIECPVEKRESHLIVVLKQLNLYNDSYLPIIREYADEWKPVGLNDNEWRRSYLETGSLPDCIRRCDLRRAIAWNKKLKQDCLYDYIP